MRPKQLVALVLVVALLGCAGAAAGTRPGRGAPNMVTRDQLSATNAENVYDAIVKLRPDWLSSRGPVSVTDPTPTTASVFMNGTLLGKADYLREVRILDVSEVRYWDAGTASARFGMGHPRGVIELTRK